MRYLAIDFGEKRTGFAVGDSDSGVVQPAGAVVTATDEQRMREVHIAIDEYGPNELIVGLPLNMDGSEGPAAKRVRHFAEKLQRQSRLTVRLVDERLTSDEANRQMAQSGLTHKQKKARRDALAAATILRDYLNNR